MSHFEGRSLLRRLKVAISPQLKTLYGPEVYWTWRLLLSGIGLPWEEVSIDSSDYDVAYVLENQRVAPCRLRINARPEYWAHRSSLRLTGIKESNGWRLPAFENELFYTDFFRVADNCVVCTRDLIFDIFWLVTGQAEQQWTRDEKDRFQLNEAQEDWKHVFRLALASGIGDQMENLFLELGFPIPVPRWPQGKRAAVCVGHDVDYPEVIRWLEPLRIVHKRGLQGFSTAVSVLTGKRNHWHIPSWVQAEKRLNIKSAFYFVPRQGSLLRYALGTPDPFYDVRSRRFRALFQVLLDEGFEIGMHASYQAFESQERFANEKYLLEHVSGQPIEGNRHHYFHLDPDNSESTLLLHERIGLKYDTSLGHALYIGWRRSFCWPFFPFHQGERREIKTLQLSTAWMDDHLFRRHEHNPGDRGEILRALADVVAEQGGCLVIDIHDYVFDEVLFPEWAKTYFALLGYLLERSDFWIETPKAIAQHWQQRHASILQNSEGLTERGY